LTVDCSVSDDGGRLIAALSGDLDLLAVAGVRLSLLKCLAEHPSALVLDLSGLTVSDPLALTVLGAVRRQASRWPGIPLLLSAPGPPTHALLRRAPHSSLPMFRRSGRHSPRPPGNATRC
jgi:anti-anti-sigma regulatory factor